MIENFPYEGYIDKNYNTYIEDGNAVVTLEFKGYGKVEFVLFKNTELNTNSINFFVYLVKKGLYRNAHVGLASSSAIQFGDQELKKQNVLFHLRFIQVFQMDF